MACTSLSLMEIKHLDLVKSETESILAFSELGADNFEFTYVTSDVSNTFVLDSVQNIKKESVLIEGQEIDKYDLDGDILYRPFPKWENDN